MVIPEGRRSALRRGVCCPRFHQDVTGTRRESALIGALSVGTPYALLGLSLNRAR